MRPDSAARYRQALMSPTTSHHPCGSAGRNAGVSFEDCRDLLGHKSARITDHYSAPEIGNLVKAANKACKEKPRKSPADDFATGGTIREVSVSA